MVKTDATGKDVQDKQDKWKTKPIGEKYRPKYWKAAIAIAIPVILVAYLIYANIAPLGGSYEYFIDVGSQNDTAGVAKITGPFDRIYERNIDNDLYAKTGKILNYMEISNGLVYFEVEDPIANDRRVVVSVEMRFKDTLPANGKMAIGAKNGSGWDYSFTDVYMPLYERIKAGSKYLYLAGNPDEFEALNISEGSAVGVFNLPFKADASSRIDGYAISGDLNVFNLSIRGAPTFYTYIGSGEDLDMEVTKQDMNLYNNSDDLALEAYDMAGNLVANITIPDDGTTNATRVGGNMQVRTLNASGLAEGVYRIEMKNNGDLTIKQIITPHQYLVSKKIFLIDNGTLYVNMSKSVNIGFQTYHASALQNVSIDNISVNVNNVSKEFEVAVGAGAHIISVPKGDMIVSSDGYLSLSKESWFSPFRYSITNVKSESDLSGLDAVVAYFGNYTFAKKEEGGWATVGASWPASGLFVKDSKLNFVISLPHLGKNQTANLTVPLDWIRIKLTKPAL